MRADVYAGIYTAKMLMANENAIENRQISTSSIGFLVMFMFTQCAKSQKHGIVIIFAIAASLMYNFISRAISALISEPKTFLMAVCFLCSVVKYMHIANNPVITKIMAMSENDPMEYERFLVLP